MQETAQIKCSPRSAPWWHHELIVADREISLLVVFKDGSLIPFHVHRCPDGTRLMTGLLNRCADLVQKEYEYTEAELKVLRFADWNRPVRPK